MTVIGSTGVIFINWESALWLFLRNANKAVPQSVFFFFPLWHNFWKHYCSNQRLLGRALSYLRIQISILLEPWQIILFTSPEEETTYLSRGAEITQVERVLS